ncbi:glycosyltransferase [Lactococcus hircilactis]|uniref:Glycosyltransferase n=1 Tax=Lactococcus hircilactis TaxID=1494462 RepID=A0A7X1ZAW1_9LACT|nr:glycosyltransferase [Lactococcus hircilactis]MQW40504.1 glycosyltransferase [Lactococcus hircilactis]
MSKNYGSRAERRAQETARQSTSLEDEKNVMVSETPAMKENSQPLANESLLNRAVRERLGEEKDHYSWVSYGVIFVMGFILSLTFYSFPLINTMATAVPSQYLYSGFAMTHGLTPYNDFFGSGGALFYFINWIGNLAGNSILLYVFELIALVASGILAYRLVVHQTLSNDAGVVVSAFTMATAAGLARGGVAPTLLAFPFALWAVKFLDVYFQEDRKDGTFVLFGMAGAVVLTISPVMFIFFLVSSLALLIFNVSQLRIGRGIYQGLCMVFGLLLVGYAVAYYALDQQTIYTSLEQSIFIPVTHFGLRGDVLLTLAQSLVLLLVFGIVTGFVLGVFQVRVANTSRVWYVLLLIGAVVVSVMAVMAPTFDSSNFLAVLPFLMIFQGKSMAKAVEEKKNLWLTYLQNKLFAPIMVVIFVFAAPFIFAALNHSTFTSEKAVVQYIKDNTSSKDSVYVLSADKNINRLSKRTSKIDTVPEYYPTKFKQTYDLNIATAQNKWIVIQSSYPIPNSLSATLKANYQSIGSGKGEFTIYKKK